MSQDDLDVGVERVCHRDHGSQLRIAGSREQTTDARGILANPPRQFRLGQAALDAKLVEGVHDRVDRLDLPPFALELGSEHGVGELLGEVALVRIRPPGHEKSVTQVLRELYAVLTWLPILERIPSTAAATSDTMTS